MTNSDLTNLVLDKKYACLLELIDANKEDKILVIGTGVCPKIEFFLSSKYDCTDITSGDIDKSNVENGKLLLPKFEFMHLDAQKRFKFKNNSFDKIIFTDVLEHLKDEKIALQEIRRILDRTGKLIVGVPKSRWFNLFSPITWVQHKREYSEKGLRKVLKENGLKIEKMTVGGNIFNFLSLWIHLIYKYFFGVLHPNLFFQEKIDKSYVRGYKGKGTDIMAVAAKN